MASVTAIPFLRVSGTHREVGRQVGAATAETVRRAVAAPFDSGRVEPFRAVTAEHLPWALDELEGVADGAGVDAFAVFAASVVELATGDAPALDRCTGLVVIAGGHRRRAPARRAQQRLHGGERAGLRSDRSPPRHPHTGSVHKRVTNKEHRYHPDNHPRRDPNTLTVRKLGFAS
jgi:hypothetical protein